MNSLLTWLCLFSLFVPAAMGVLLSIVLHRRLGGWAYVVGYALPPLGLIGLYGLYLLWLRGNPCEPADSLGCGEAVGYALVIFVVYLAITLLLGAAAQLLLFFILRARRGAPR